ncbi:hypothetical protein [Alteribacillus sp. HJP-4]|uniref:hypothetical protein n=1 Tax=Alteribacillus sp. HJP-4 TaxID=2775394 RepID=UPI0035CD1BD8
MSDFIYKKKPAEPGSFIKEIQTIYQEDKPEVREFHGEWGTLAVSENLYHGFQPHESEQYITVVLGGPVLCFQENDFLQDGDQTAGTTAVHERWLHGRMKWDEDVSGPFVVFILNKQTSELTCVTDLMAFIPVYACGEKEDLLLATHVDMLAGAAGEQNNVDVASQADFILHGIVTYPYTAYTNLRQLAPASVHTSKEKGAPLQTEEYWLPKEIITDHTLEQTAAESRHSLQNYVDTTVQGLDPVAQFISGGEDSRVLSALLPGKIRRDAYIFLDGMNREGEIAKKAAVAYGAEFHVETRNKTHYLNILPSAADLVGSGSQFHHVHTFGFHKKCNLNRYAAVYGGLFSDALLKGARIKKIRGSTRFPFVPQIKRRSYSAGAPVSNKAFTKEILSEITKRRQAHLEYVKSLRPESSEEWFELWPSSMNMNIPNLHGNRRLFRSYEPFMAKDIVKLSASIPQKWKMNRRLFQKAAKPLLQPTKWLFHGEGKLPYYPWFINVIIQFVIWAAREIKRKTGKTKAHQESWADWLSIMGTEEWQRSIDQYADGINIIAAGLKKKDVHALFSSGTLTKSHRINLMQVIYHGHKKNNR